MASSSSELVEIDAAENHDSAVAECVDLVEKSQNLIGKQIIDFIEMVCLHSSDGNGSNTNENLACLVSVLAWQDVKVCHEGNSKQMSKEIQWESAAIKAKDVIENLPTVTYFRENLFCFFGEETWPDFFN